MALLLLQWHVGVATQTFSVLQVLGQRTSKVSCVTMWRKWLSPPHKIDAQVYWCLSWVTVFFPRIHEQSCDLGGHFKTTHELLNERVLKSSPVNKIYIFQCMGKIFFVEFQRYPLKFHTNIPPIPWKVWFLYNSETLRTVRLKSSYAFLKRPWGWSESLEPRNILSWHAHFSNTSGTTFFSNSSCLTHWSQV